MGRPIKVLPDIPPPAADCRCLCGNLLARLVKGGVELKCRRCKRTHLVPLSPPAPAPPRAAPGVERSARKAARS